MESSFDFASVSANSATGPGGSASNLGSGPGADGTVKTAVAPDPHDWDAIFATLDSPTDSAATATAPATNIPVADGPSKEARPDAPGRALTEGGEHDDPILKNLTSMGYSRKDSLLALEKYDYNLERVSVEDLDRLETIRAARPTG